MAGPDVLQHLNCPSKLETVCQKGVSFHVSPSSVYMFLITLHVECSLVHALPTNFSGFRIYIYYLKFWLS